jgi:hypothetical protein
MMKRLLSLVGLALLALQTNTSLAVDSYRYLHVSIETPWMIFLFLLVAVFVPWILILVLMWRRPGHKPSDSAPPPENSKND